MLLSVHAIWDSPRRRQPNISSGRCFQLLFNCRRPSMYVQFGVHCTRQRVRVFVNRHDLGLDEQPTMA